MPATDQLTATFSMLREILARYAAQLEVQDDTPASYSLNAAYSERWKRVILFGSAQIKQRYVSYHLFPVYMFPDILDGVAPELRLRMQGKSCFNFKVLSETERQKLELLTERGFRRFEAEGLAPVDKSAQAPVQGRH